MEMWQGRSGLGKLRPLDLRWEPKIHSKLLTGLPLRFGSFAAGSDLCGHRSRNPDRLMRIPPQDDPEPREHEQNGYLFHPVLAQRLKGRFVGRDVEPEQRQQEKPPTRVIGTGAPEGAASAS